MPQGVLFLQDNENFVEIIEKGAYYVDKTAYLKELFLTRAVKNPFFIRPHRFGKTLNMSMIKEFCKLNYQNPSDKSYQQKLFIDNGRNLAVAGVDYKELREKIMGEFPVISISLKNVGGDTFIEALSKFLDNIGRLYEEFAFLGDSTRLDPDDITHFKDIQTFCISKNSNLNEEHFKFEASCIVKTSIPELGTMLYKEYGRQVIVIIDDYDVPLQKAVEAKEPYYDEMLSIISVLSGNTFKMDTFPWLEMGIVTVCLRVAYQSYFSDANNFTYYDLKYDPYSGFFGFTEDETRKLISDCGLTDKEEKVRAWYGGYRFEKQHVFCPGSLVNYCDEAKSDRNIEPKSFFIDSGGSDLLSLFIKNSMEAHDAGNINELQSLLDDRNVEISLSEFTTYPDLSHNLSFDTFMTLMLHTGYVTYSDDSGILHDHKISIPNCEALEYFKAKQQIMYSEHNPYWLQEALSLVDLLMENKIEEARSLMNDMLRQFFSLRHFDDELYYHDFMLKVTGLAASTRNLAIHEELESGEGFTDIVMENLTTKSCCILKLKKADSIYECYDVAEEATRQLQNRDYAATFIEKGYKRVYGIGIGFAQKFGEIVSLGNLAEASQN